MPALVQLAVELGGVVAARPHLPVEPGDGDEHEQVEQADEEEEGPRHRRADEVVAARGGQSRGWLTWRSSARIPKFSATARAKTTLECPSEKKKPTPSGRLPSPTSLRVVLSMAAMWSASKAWRTPRVYARHAGAEAEQLGLRDVEVLAHRSGQQAPTDHVEHHDGSRHASRATPTPAWSLSARTAGHAARRPCHVLPPPMPSGPGKSTLGYCDCSQ